MPAHVPEGFVKEGSTAISDHLTELSRRMRVTGLGGVADECAEMALAVSKLVTPVALVVKLPEGLPEGSTVKIERPSTETLGKVKPADLIAEVQLGRRKLIELCKCLGVADPSIITRYVEGVASLDELLAASIKHEKAKLVIRLGSIRPSSEHGPVFDSGRRYQLGQDVQAITGAGAIAELEPANRAEPTVQVEPDPVVKVTVRLPTIQVYDEAMKAGVLTEYARARNDQRQTDIQALLRAGIVVEIEPGGLGPKVTRIEAVELSDLTDLSGTKP